MHHSESPFSPPQRLPQTLVQHWARPLVRFLEIEAASGVILLACTLAAVVLANSPWQTEFAALWNQHIYIGIGNYRLDESLLHWVNDGLMTIFFFVVGLEIKREIVAGELRDVRKVACYGLNRIGVRRVLVYLLAGCAIWLAVLQSGVHPTVAGVQRPTRPDASCLTGESRRRAAGLVLGKPVGIVLFSRAAVRMGIARLPTGVNWRVMVGAGCLAGIGFTMSLFIAGLALEGDLLNAAKVGALAGSTTSAVLGFVLLVRNLPAAYDQTATPVPPPPDTPGRARSVPASP